MLIFGGEGVVANEFRMEIGCPNAPAKKIDGLTRDINLQEWKRTLATHCPQDWKDGWKDDVLTQPVKDEKPSRRFTFRDAGDINGGDLGQPLRSVSYPECIVACQRDARCIGFAFDRFNDYCFLKQEIAGPVRYDPASTLGVLSNLKVTPSDAPQIIEVFRDAVFYDQSYREISDYSFEACRSVCQSDARCEAFSFMKATNLCRLIKRPYQYCRRQPKVFSEYCASRRYISADSGVKRQPD